MPPQSSGLHGSFDGMCGVGKKKIRLQYTRSNVTICESVGDGDRTSPAKMKQVKIWICLRYSHSAVASIW
ncbi:hypothetical protein CsSME_00024438 [Camellia sinensis var. sinensis]